MGECDSTFLKSRTPRITVLDNYCYPPAKNLQCPIRKGIIYYSRGSTLFERNIHRSSKHEPRILGSGKSPASTELLFFKLIPIESNRVLLMRLDGPQTIHSFGSGSLVERSDFEECSDSEGHSSLKRPGDSERPSNASLSFLELSIHEIRHYRLGPALWTYRGDSDKPDLDDLLMPLRSPTDILGNTFDKNCIGQMKLLPMILEAGLLHFDGGKDLGANFACSPDGRIFGVRLHKEVVAMLHSSSADTGFDLVTQLPIPFTTYTRLYCLLSVPPAFSADGSKFAVTAGDGTVSVWDVRNKTPLMVKRPNPDVHDVDSLHFSRGNLRREVLAFTELLTFDTGARIRLIDATSFEFEETLDMAPIPQSNPIPIEWSNVFFDPDGKIMYVGQNGSLFEWKLWTRDGPEWWLGEGYPA